MKTTQYLRKTSKVYSVDSLLYSTVKGCASSVRDIRQSFEDDPLRGRPIYSITPENIELVKELVAIDPHLSQEETVRCILHDNEQDMQHETRDSLSKKFLESFEICVSRSLNKIVTDDETWIKC